ncbi:astacin-like metalloprotease toxin 1 [Trichonephila inaurata madagascariensis]|uniref:Metalloendopeptidase n=1 Tax=Trichonephila inaurata madagascariensis TaxID=2747483 RepID=A0A8X6XXV6_9ARAC|nr:astacin-like metalloprotease toxin 1 [Trichonephila inaurata madagascariensis]
MKVILVLLLAAVAYSKPAEFRNPMINEGLFEGDIMGIDPNEDRNAVPRDSMRWPNGIIPYEVDPSLYPIWELLMKSIRHIEENSCIRFVQKTVEKDYVRMFKGNGCWSFWGMLGNGEQKLSLGNGCHYFGTVVHEFLHALGFEHEHNRSDRDDYLTINWENIEQQWYYAFKKLRPEQNRLLSSFDYDSIMLYGEKSFAKSWSVKSMTAKDGRFLDEAYNKPGMSPGDIARLNKLYNCPSK